jgi:hypothetical protein
LGRKVNKCVFIRYPDESKGYVMLGEHPDGGVTEIVSRDVEFMENDFPSWGDVGQSLELYEMVESWDDTPAINLGDSGREIIPSGSDPQPQEDDSQSPQLRRSQRGNVSR